MNLPYPDFHLHVTPSASFKISGRIGTVFLNSTSTDDFQSVKNSESETVMPFYGIHPWYVDSETAKGDNIKGILNKTLSENSFCGIGECGLDSRQRFKSNIDIQIKIFEYQLELAAIHKKPLSIHCVRAWGQLFSCLKRFLPLPVPFILHSFYGPGEVLQDLLKAGSYISLSSISLRNPEKSFPVIRSIPSDRLLVESDLQCGSNNFSEEYHFNILQKNYKNIADIRSISETELVSGVIENGKVFTD